MRQHDTHDTHDKEHAASGVPWEACGLLTDYSLGVLDGVRFSLANAQTLLKRRKRRVVEGHADDIVTRANTRGHSNEPLTYERIARTDFPPGENGEATVIGAWEPTLANAIAEHPDVREATGT